MDGLALLCNLFADGPVTLKRLRLARVTSLAELERTPPARLAEWLHASPPQAQAFVEEARRLARRLAEDSAQPPPFPLRRAQPAPVPERVRAREHAAPPSDVPAGTVLRPGLVPGLDESVCARLQRQKVHTLEALSERAGLDLARRTGIPYSRLLELARAARRRPVERAPAAEPTLSVEPGERDAENVYVLRPAPRLPARPLPEVELAGSDAFTLPEVEPEAAGPFG